jgi:hypothetical protein
MSAVRLAAHRSAAGPRGRWRFSFRPFAFRRAARIATFYMDTEHALMKLIDRNLVQKPG